jgi:hypothetical protein
VLEIPIEIELKMETETETHGPDVTCHLGRWRSRHITQLEFSMHNRIIVWRKVERETLDRDELTT